MKSADFALAVIAGEEAAASSLGRITACTAAPDELSHCLSSLTSEAARSGFLRAIQKQLEQTRQRVA